MYIYVCNWITSLHTWIQQDIVSQFYFNLGFPSDSVVKNPTAMQETQETWVWSPGQEDPLEEDMTIHSSILAWKIP